MSAPGPEISGHAPELPYQITFQTPHAAPFVVIEKPSLDLAKREIVDRAMWLSVSVGGTWHRVGAGLGPSEIVCLSPASRQVLGTFAIRRRIPAFRRQLPVDAKTTNGGGSV